MAHSTSRSWSPRLPAIVLAAAFLTVSGFASDHADPMSLDVFKLQEDPDANITDLHAFFADANGHEIVGRDATLNDCLIVSLCMHRALKVDEANQLQLKGYSFRVHIDLDPPVSIFDPAQTPTGDDYKKALEAADEAVANAGDPGKRTAASAARGRLIAAHDSAAQAQALYGGIFTDPPAIAEDVLLDYELDLARPKEGLPEAFIPAGKARIEGVDNTRTPNVVDRRPGSKSTFQPNVVNVTAGIFDDPFIFPRFFRRNVVAVVTSIPLKDLRRSNGTPALSGPIALWATTHKGNKQIDHVGRSLRTQLPRFGYLNDKHPAQHVAAIIKVHDKPNLIEDVTAVVIAPLLAHRYYDTVPDVMLFDLRKPAHFPNGRRLVDDVAQLLADAGEPLLYELSYAESRQFPRATTNDKAFSADFPFLAPRWTQAQVDADKDPGATLLDATGGSYVDPSGKPYLDKDGKPYRVPRAQDAGATRPLDLDGGIWVSLWEGEVIGLGLFAVLMLITLRRWPARVVALVLAAAGFWVIVEVPMPPPVKPVPGLPAMKVAKLEFGGGVIAVLAVWWIYALGRRHGAQTFTDPRIDRQGLIPDDRQPARTSYAELREAMFAVPYSVAPWGSREAAALPQYELTFASVARHLLTRARYPFLEASRRTLHSHADLRWGDDRRGFKRLLHPNGIILTGEWTIDAAPPDTAYTGYFAPGKKGRVIARYSTCCTETRSGSYRSLALVAKIYPPADIDGPPVRPASLVTQEDIGGTVTSSIRDAVLTNSPPVTPLARGAGIFSLLLTGFTLGKADVEISERQLYEIAELEKPAGERTSCPRFLRLIVTGTRATSHVDCSDFREEIMATIYNPGDPQPKRTLDFDIEVSDAGERTGRLNQRLEGQQWTRIGRLRFGEAVTSYNGDFVVHFHHPPWRDNRNDPKSINPRSRAT